MKLYSMPLSPFASRIRLAIYHKHLDVEIVAPPEGGTRSEAYLAKNPMGQVPALELDSGVVIPEILGDPGIPGGRLPDGVAASANA